MSAINAGNISVSSKINIPKLTTAQRNALGNQAGLLVYNTDDLEVQVNTGSQWIPAGKLSFGALFPFTTFTFTNGGATLNNGPSRQSLISTYNTTANPWLNDSQFYDVPSPGIQRFTVPKDGTYRITAIGAVGGQGAYGQSGGNGANMRGDFALVQGEKLWICVGQSGGNYVNPYNAGAGGGGSFVSKGSNLGTSTALIVAGGGGGGGTSYYFGYSPGYGAPTTNNGDTAGSVGPAAYAQPGASFSFNSSGYGGTYPLGFRNGATGGSGLYNCIGGFGGGGDTYHTGAGGGGYSGGNTGQYYYSAPNGFGGGSFNNGTNQSNTGSANAGMGSVTITIL
jgi:hypothetical protein